MLNLDTLAVSGKPKRQLRISVSYQPVSVFVSHVYVLVHVCVCVCARARVFAQLVRTCLESLVSKYTYERVCDNMIQTKCLYVDM